MICMKNLRFSSRLRAKGKRHGPPGSVRAQPCNNNELLNKTCYVLLMVFGDYCIEVKQMKLGSLKGDCIHYDLQMNAIYQSTVNIGQNLWGGSVTVIYRFTVTYTAVIDFDCIRVTLWRVP